MPWALAKDEAKKDRLADRSVQPGRKYHHRCVPAGTFYAGDHREDPSSVEYRDTQIFEELKTFGGYTSGNKVTEKPEILFAASGCERSSGKSRSHESAAQAKPEVPEEQVIDIDAKEEITFDDFGKMQFQVGEIIACEEVKKSRKLLCSQVKIGSQVKQIVSGIKAHLHAGRNGRKESYGSSEPETCKTGRRIFPKVCCCAQKMRKAIWL